MSWLDAVGRLKDSIKYEKEPPAMTTDAEQKSNVSVYTQGKNNAVETVISLTKEV